jgi:hypothetical protein
MNIGIITLATGKYNIFLNDFLKSVNEKFFNNLKRKIIYLTDDLNFKIEGNNFKKLYFDHKPWPFATLNKIKAINHCKNELKGYDIIFWMDVDLKVIDYVNNYDDVFPTIDKRICCVTHCGWLDENRNEVIHYPYERNPNSKAYVEDIYKVPYHQACFFGGFNEDFFKMTGLIERNINLDLSNNIIAIYHDESHLNRYFQDYPPKSIPKTYARPLAMGDLLPNTKIISVLKNDEQLRH